MEKCLAWLSVPRLVGIILSLAFLQIAIFTFTWGPASDEPAHVGTGLELVSSGSYKYERMHPPLARVLAALPVYVFLGREQPAADCPEDFDAWRADLEINRPGGAFGHYCLSKMPYAFMDDTALYVARIPMWFAYALMLYAVYLLGRELKLSRNAALLACVFAGSVPMVMWLARTVMTDLVFMATASLTLYALVRLQNRMRLKDALLLGVFAALAALSKLTAFYYLPVIGAFWLALNTTKADTVRLAVLLAFALLVAALLIAAGWLFDVEAFREALLTASMKAEHGHHGKIFPPDGQAHRGTWYFYPALLLVRVPVVWHLFCIYGGAALWREQRRSFYLLGSAAIIILLMAIPTQVNINIHHMILIFAPLSLIAAYGAAKLWESAAGKALVIAGCFMLISGTEGALGYKNTIAYYYQQVVIYGL